MISLKPHWAVLLLLSIGHLVTDLSQGVLPILLPFFKEAFALSYTATGVIVLSANLSSSVVQPVFGFLTDRFSLHWLLPAGCLLSAIGIAAAGLSPSYLVLLPLVLISGLGVASYHPEACKIAHYASGERRASSMAVFSVGGNLGVGLGPLLVLFLVSQAGLKGTLGLLVPGLVTSLFLLLALPVMKGLVQKGTGKHPAQPVVPASNVEAFVPGVQEGSGCASRSGGVLATEDPSSLPGASTGGSRDPVPYLAVTTLLAFIILRSFFHFGFTNYIPLYYMSYRGGDPVWASMMLSIFLLSGAVGTMVGGPLADRWGLKTMLIASMLILIPLTYLYLYVQGFWGLVIVALIGFTVVSTFAVTLVMGQELLSRHIGVASGLMLGFGVGTGGLGVTFLGSIADTWGVPTALQVLGVFPVLSLLLLLFLPGPKARERKAVS